MDSWQTSGVEQLELHLVPRFNMGADVTEADHATGLVTYQTGHRPWGPGVFTIDLDDPLQAGAGHWLHYKTGG